MEILEPDGIHLRRRNHPRVGGCVRTGPGDVLAAVGERADAANIFRGVEVVEVEPVRQPVLVVDDVIRFRSNEVAAERQREITLELGILRVRVYDPRIQLMMIFEGAEQEEPVLLDGASDGASRFVTVELALASLEVIEGAEVLVAEEEEP